MDRDGQDDTSDKKKFASGNGNGNRAWINEMKLFRNFIDMVVKSLHFICNVILLGKSNKIDSVKNETRMKLKLLQIFRGRM